MKKHFLDLHIHIGRSGDGKAVKITASKDLTLPNILEECQSRKGIEMIGIVDCASIGVLSDLRELLAGGELTELPEGGFRYRDRLTLLAGVELETREESGGQGHYLAFFPTLPRLVRFASFVATRVKNPQLSSQSCYCTAPELLHIVDAMGGVFIPAHVFTPHKSLFGACAASLAELFGPEAEKIKAVEMGLSADAEMAFLLPGLRERVLFSNSDAHSPPKLGRGACVFNTEMD